MNKILLVFFFLAVTSNLYCETNPLCNDLEDRCDIIFKGKEAKHLFDLLSAVPGIQKEPANESPNVTSRTDVKSKVYCFGYKKQQEYQCWLPKDGMAHTFIDTRDLLQKVKILITGKDQLEALNKALDHSANTVVGSIGKRVEKVNGPLSCSSAGQNGAYPSCFIKIK